MNNFQDLIEDYPDFPSKGILFKDILPILKKPDVFKELIKKMSVWPTLKSCDAIIAIDARGFIFGSSMALNLDKPLILARKKGKLPPPVISREYELEYGTDTLEIKPGDGEKVIIVDDVYATGGTAKATRELCKEAGYEVVDEIYLINLSFLNKDKVKSVLTY